MRHPFTSNSKARPNKIFIAAGEVSGDRQAAQLARALRAQAGDVVLFGAGGEEMRAAGIDVHLFTPHLGCVGLLQSLRFAPKLYQLFNELRRLVQREKPTLIVLVDNEGFNTRLARFLRKEGIPIIFYFAPQVWLWGRWRARAIAKVSHLIIPAFPHELSVYRRSGARVQWVGHPLLDTAKATADTQRLFETAGLDHSQPTLAVMPGSRLQELRRFTPTMLQAVDLIQRRRPELQVILPLAATYWDRIVREQLERSNMQDRVTVVTGDSCTWLSRCSLAIVKSGTSTLEAALMGVPMVVCYRIDAATYLLGRLLVRTDFIAMPNILAGRQIVPELLQHRFTVANIVSESLRILEDAECARAMREQLANLRDTLGSEGSIDRAAALILGESGEARGADVS